MIIETNPNCQKHLQVSHMYPDTLNTQITMKTVCQQQGHSLWLLSKVTNLNHITLYQHKISLSEHMFCICPRMFTTTR